MVEYIQGNDGYLISHEAFLYGFDAVLMFLSMISFMSQNVGTYYVAFGTFKRNRANSVYSSGSVSDKEAFIRRDIL